MRMPAVPAWRKAAPADRGRQALPDGAEMGKSKRRGSCGAPCQAGDAVVNVALYPFNFPSADRRMREDTNVEFAGGPESMGRRSR